MRRLAHIQAMRTKKMILTKRLTGFAIRPFPDCIFRTMGIRMTMKIVGRSHMIPNNGMLKTALKFCVFTTSMIMNGTTNSRPMRAGDLKFVKVFFIGSP